MKFRIELKFTTLIFLMLFLQNCKKKDYSDNEQTRLDNWVESSVMPWAGKLGYPVEKTNLGTYFINIQEGLGETPTIDKSILIHFTAKTLNGKLFSTDSIVLAKASGIYNYEKYYLPAFFSLKDIEASALCEAILKMRVGGKSRILFTSAKRLDFNDFKKISEPVDMSIELLKIYNTTDEYENEQINECTSVNNLILENIEPGIAYRKLISNPTGSPIGNYEPISISIMVWYLNNQLIYTNIADSAKKYGIYDERIDYSFIDFDFNSNTWISAMSLILKNLKGGESAISIFNSKFAYGGKGYEYIPCYCPLKMYVYVEDNSIIYLRKTKSNQHPTAAKNHWGR